MKSPLEAAKQMDPEDAIQERFSALSWALFIIASIWIWLTITLWVWLRTRHDCSWCRHRISGNPLSRRVSHHICDDCWEKHFPNFIRPGSGTAGNLNHGTERAVSSPSSGNLLGRPERNSRPVVAFHHKQIND